MASFVRRIFEEGFNRGNLAAADELVAPDMIEHGNVVKASTGPETVKQVAIFCRNLFPDVHFAIEQMIAEGEKVTAYLTVSGTHQGDLIGIPLTGKRVSSLQIHIMRIADGKMAEHWEVRDELAMLRQLGAVPAPAR
jgi:steroid delta-isomerase-like uncharacterized protein